MAQILHEHEMDGAHRPDCKRCRIETCAPELLEKLKEFNELFPDTEATVLIAIAEGRA